MPIPPIQKQRCLQVMDTILEQNISKMFLNPVNPETDNCADYFTKISHPMDLTTSRNKLLSDSYETVEDWKNDIELIWNNAFTYHGTQVLISLLAKELQTMFKNLTANLTSDQIFDWNAQFEKLKSELNQAVKNYQKNPQSKQQKTSRPNSVSNAIPAQSQTSRPNFGAAEETSLAQSNITDSIQPLTEEEIMILGEQVKNIEDPDHVQQIINLVKRLEAPSSFESSADEDSDFVLEIENLKASTLIELKNLVSRLLNL